MDGRDDRGGLEKERCGALSGSVARLLKVLLRHCTKFREWTQSEGLLTFRSQHACILCLRELIAGKP